MTILEPNYQPESPSNQQWTEGDDHPGTLLTTDDWNVVPLTKDELYGFCGLISAVSQALQCPHPSTLEHLLHFEQIMQGHYERWTHFEI